MDLRAKPLPKSGTQAKFMLAEFRKMMQADGLHVVWEQAAECPCARKLASAVSLGSITDRTENRGTSSEPRVDCPVCKGKGYFHHSPQEIRAIVTAAESNPKRFELWGENAVGMIRLTLLPENLPGYLDRFTFAESVILFRETRTRTGETVESLRYPVVTRTLDLQATGETTVNVLKAHKASLSGVAALDGDLVVGEDFEVVDGKIDWTLGDTSGRAPEVGGRYSMSYYASPAYVVLTHPHVFRDTIDPFKRPAPIQKSMVVQAICRLEFYGP
jgi:hypothetical protein